MVFNLNNADGGNLEKESSMLMEWRWFCLNDRVGLINYYFNTKMQKYKY